MATKKTGPFIGVETLRHADDKRKNIPTAEYQSLMAEEAKKPVQVKYPRGGNTLYDEKQHRNRDLDPQLVWRGKDEQDWTAEIDAEAWSSALRDWWSRSG